MSPATPVPYVVGFRFSPDLRRVVLIRKNRPDWQKGLLNGVGGRIEADETPERAMAREFAEEAGEATAPRDWTLFATLSSPDAQLHFLSSLGDPDQAATATDDTRVRAAETLDDLSRTLASLRALAEYIQTHPEAMVLGKARPEVQPPHQPSPHPEVKR